MLLDWYSSMKKKSERFRWFWHRKLTSKVKIRHFLTIQNSKFNNFFLVCLFLGKNLSNFVSPLWKLHNWYYHNGNLWKYVVKTHFLFCSATVAGWGRTTKKRNRTSQMFLLHNKVNVEKLQKLFVPIVNDQCTKSNSRVKINPRIQLCAGGVKGWYS